VLNSCFLIVSLLYGAEDWARAGGFQGPDVASKTLLVVDLLEMMLLALPS